jgi:heme exporter protein C
VVAVLALLPRRSILPFNWEIPLGIAGFVMLAVGNGFGLFYAPSERFMGQVGRIIYSHVPSAWVGMICFLLAAVFAAGFLFTNRRKWDSAMEAACEVGVLEGVLMLLTGAIFGRPTWGVWWTWDPRLTSAAVMTMSFVGVLLLRGIVREPDRRATWSAIATILAGINVPIVYMSVQWWASLHQTQSEGMGGSMIDPAMRWVLYFNALALLFVTIWFIALRTRIAERRAEAEMPEPLPEVAT